MMQAQVSNNEPSVAEPSCSRPCPPNSDVKDLNDIRLLHAVSKERNIDSTKSLVAAYNATTDQSERGVLLPWLRQYNTRSEECSRPETVFEYSELAKIVPCGGHDDHLLREFIGTFHCRLRECRGELLHENIAKALFRSLTWVESSVHEDPVQLLDLATDLVSTLSFRSRLTRQNFSQYEAAFLAIHHVLHVLHEIGRSGLLEDEKKKLRQVIAKKKTEMKSSMQHYPVQFNFGLIQQAVERLETKNAPSRITQAARYALSALYGGAHILHLLKDLVRLDINPEAFEDACTKIRNVIARRGVSEKQWYDLLQSLIAARLRALKSAEKIELFFKVYEIVMERQRKIKRGEEQKALRYGIIQEITMLANQASCAEVREVATTKLLELATNTAVLDSWSDDSDLLLALLDAVHEIHVLGECKPKTAETLREMERCCREHDRETLATWLGHDTMEAKLQMQRQEETNPQCREMFVSIGKDVGYIPLATIRYNVENLKEKYLHDKFAVVPPLFEREVGKHVKNMEHHVVMYKEFSEKRRTEERDENPEEHHEQKKNIPTPVCIKDLFRPRSLEAGTGESEIRKVLLYGNPGSGKTCIGKVIAHKWARGEMMQEFKAIYVIPIRRLNIAKAKGVRGESLEELVANTCFEQKGSDAEFEELRTQVKDDLNVPSTLFIFDGLEEADDDARERLSEVEKSECKLLILTRPYNLQHMKKRVDIQFECLGFDDGQLENFISKELDEVDASKLTQSFLKNRELWKIVHIPLAAHVLCSLSKRRGTVIDGLRRKASIFRIFGHMATYVWEGYQNNPQTKNVHKKIFFEDLEEVAFKALMSGQVEIDEELVEECTQWNSKAISQSGFLLRTLESGECRFWHKTFQEFFAGRHIAKCMLGESATKKREVEEFIQRGKYTEKHMLTISFAMHALTKACKEDALNCMFSTLDEQPIELLGVQHLFVKMRVLEARIEEAGTQDELEVVLKDEGAKKLIERARELSMRTIDDAPLRQIVVEKFEQCSNVLEIFPKVVSDTLVEGVKESLASERNLKKGEKVKILDVLKLAERCPEHNDGINEWRLKLTNTDIERSSVVEGMKRKVTNASEASYQLQDLLSTLEEEWSNEGSNAHQNPEATGKSFELQSYTFYDISVMMWSLCAYKDVYVRQKAMKTIGSIIEATPQIASYLLPMLEIGCSDEVSGVCEAAKRTINDIEPEKVIPPTVESLPAYKGGLLLLFALKAFTIDPLKKSERATFCVHATFSQEIGKWDRIVLKQYVKLLRREFEEKFPGLLYYLRQENEQNTLEENVYATETVQNH